MAGAGRALAARSGAGSVVRPCAGSVAVLVVTHRGPGAMLRRCLESIDRADRRGFVVVVDNGGHGGADVSDYGPGVAHVLRVDNAGFGAAVNAGVLEVDRLGATAGRRPDHVALLNDDVEVTEDWLRPLVGALDSDADLGAVQPKLLLAGTEPPLVNSVGVGFDAAGAGSDIGFGEVDGPAWSRPSPIEAFTGGAVLFRRAFLEDVGGFDERYFLYYEDVDLALRGAERGWCYRCEPASVVLHAQGSTTGALGDRLAFLRERNRLWTLIRFRRPSTIARGLWLSARRVRHAPRRAHLHALLAGLGAAPGLLLERRRAGAAR